MHASYEIVDGAYRTCCGELITNPPNTGERAISFGAYGTVDCLDCRALCEDSRHRDGLGTVVNIRNIGRNLTPDPPPGRYEVLVATPDDPDPGWNSAKHLCYEPAGGFDGAILYAHQRGYRIAQHLLTHSFGVERIEPLELPGVLLPSGRRMPVLPPGYTSPTVRNTCERCDESPAERPHLCPYQADVNINTDDSYCNCCDECRRDCLESI